jgi:hypothetical protein
VTVSRTINGHRYVSEETAKKVRAAIRWLDYRPNHAARMPTGQLSRSIGLIVPDIMNTFFSVVSRWFFVNPADARGDSNKQLPCVNCAIDRLWFRFHTTGIGVGRHLLPHCDG